MMIELIEFYVEGKQRFLSYDREKYLSYLEEKKHRYIGMHYAIKQWFVDGKKMEFKYNVGIPTYNWDGLVLFTENDESIVICNVDGSIRHRVSAPEELIQWESFVEHFEISKHFKRQEYKIGFTGFNDYFEYQGKHYVQVKVVLSRKNEPFDAFIQMRYLDPDTGEFLPFTKEISRMTPNQYAYNETIVSL